MQQTLISTSSRILLTAALVVGCPGWVSGDTLCARFLSVSPNPASHRLNGVAQGAGLVVAVGDLGTVITGPSAQAGFTWKKESIAAEADLYDVIFSAGTFVAVGSGGTILISEDGDDWDEVGHLPGGRLKSVASNGSSFLSVGEDGRVVSSPDLQVWSEHLPPTNRDLEAVAWDGQEYIAVGEQGIILQSPDGLDWTAQISPTNRRFAGIDCRMSHCVAVTENAFIVSRDGEMRWTVEGEGAYSNDFRAIRWCDDRFIAVGEHGEQAASYDGIDWWPIGEGLESSSLNDVVFADGRVVAVGRGGQILGSNDYGESWELSNAIADVPLRAGTRGDGLSVVVGGNAAWYGAGQILTSANRQDWVLQFYGSLQAVYDIAFHEGRFIALSNIQEVGGAWQAIKSDDGEIWRALDIDEELLPPGFAYDIEAADSGFMMAGSNSTIGTSANGDFWQFASLDDDQGSFEGITSNGLYMVAVGWTTVSRVQGLVVTSDFDLELSRQNLGEVPKLSAVAWGADRFVAVGGEGWILTSPDGKDWARTASRTEESLFGIRWLGRGFAAVGRNGTFLTSPEGVTWTPHDLGTDADLYEVFGNAEDYMVVGDDGLLLRSSCSLPVDAPTPPLQ